METKKSNINPEEFYTISQKEFWLKWFSKLMFTLISVKLWGLVACTWVSTYLLLCHKMIVIGEHSYNMGINGAQWVTFNTTIWGLIFGMKEIFRVMDKKDKNDEKIIKEDNKAKEQIARITTSATSQSVDPGGTKPSFTPEGKEIVGNEPH